MGTVRRNWGRLVTSHVPERPIWSKSVKTTTGKMGVDFVEAEWLTVNISVITASYYEGQVSDLNPFI